MNRVPEVDDALREQCLKYDEFVKADNSPYKRYGKRNPRIVLKQLHSFALNVSLSDSVITGKMLENLDCTTKFNIYIVHPRKYPKWLQTDIDPAKPTIALYRCENGVRTAKYLPLSMSTRHTAPVVRPKAELPYTFEAAEIFKAKAPKKKTRQGKNSKESKAMALFAIEAGQ